MVHSQLLHPRLRDPWLHLRAALQRQPRLPARPGPGRVVDLPLAAHGRRRGGRALVLPAATARILETLAGGRPRARRRRLGGAVQPRDPRARRRALRHARGRSAPTGRRPSASAEETWVIHDMCAREPWPFADDFFDFSLCVTTLEDIRDPIWACQELSRVSKAGYVEVPTVEAELMQYAPGPGPVARASPPPLVLRPRGRRPRLLAQGPLACTSTGACACSRAGTPGCRWTTQLLGVFWEGELPAREQFLSYDTHAAVAGRPRGQGAGALLPVAARAGGQGAAGADPARRRAREIARAACGGADARAVVSLHGRGSPHAHRRR